MSAARGRLRLRQLQVLHRHGDRSPLANVFLGSGAQAEQHEVARWHVRLPQPKTLTSLGERFKLRNPSPPGKAMQHAPFGCLTEKGIAQMVDRGETLAAFCAREGLALDALDERDVLVYCNAYLRTQLSVQALLTGLLRDHAHLAPRVHVLPLDRDMIHSYSVYPEISTLTVRQDTENERMIEREKEMAALKQELQYALPMYRKGGAPFYWTTCADYFTCRGAHELPLLPSTAPLRDATVRHMSFRYHQFYDHRRIRSLVAGQLMDHAMKEMHKIKAGDEEAKKLVVYSGHDVSILALLHAVDADVTRAQSYWPPYASALSFELLEDEAAQWFVRVRINGEPLTLRELPSDTVALEGFADIVHDRIDIEDAFAGMP